MADYQRLITTEDIQRRYNLQNLVSDRKIIQTLNNNLTKTFGIIKNYITCMTSLGSKEQYFLSGVPTLENYPYTEWEDHEEHINTVYYDTDGGKVYIFKYNSEDEYYYWEESTDSSLLNAMSVANSQADVSEDNLRRVFYEQPTVPYNVGDIWINGSKIYRCMRNETAESEFYQDDWIDYLQYNDSVATSNALRILGEFKETVETEYVTKTLLETTTDTINAEVSKVQTLAEGKSATYTEQPTPPYYKGDTYIKEVTDSETGITMNLIYVCQYTRLEGTYHEEDFSLQPGYATLSQIKVTNDAITSTVAKVEGQDVKIAQVQQSVNEINAKIQEIANITVTETTENGFMTITGVNTSEPIEITIIPRVDDIAYLYPGIDVFPGDDTFLSVRTLQFHNTYDDTYYYLEIPDDLWYLNSEVYDEFVLHYGDGTQADPQYFEVIKRVGINENGQKYALENEEVIPYQYQHINLTDGDYEITLLGYTRAYMKITLMASNLYTTQFATKVELNTAISVTSEHFNVEVSKKVGKTEVISSINQTAEAVKIQAGKIDIAGTITAINNNTSTTINGNKITTGSIDTAQLKANAITADKIATNAITSAKISSSAITSDKIATNAVTADKIQAGAINASKIQAGSIDSSKVNSTIITTTNFSAQSINADRITAGTLNVDRINARSISTEKLADSSITEAKINKQNINQLSKISTNLGSITAGSIKIGNYFSVSSSGSTQLSNSVGFLTLKINNAHPYVSALNVAMGSGGVVFRNGQSQGSVGDVGAQVYMSNAVLYLKGNQGVNIGGVTFYSNSNGKVHINNDYVHAGNLSFGGNYVTADSGNLNLNTGSGKKILANGQQIGGLSDERVKENIHVLNKSELNGIIKEIKNMNTYYYDYKKEFGDKNNIGLIVQDIEKQEKIRKYLHLYEYRGYKGYNHEDLSQLNFIVIKELINRIEELEENYGKTVNN